MSRPQLVQQRHALLPLVQVGEPLHRRLELGLELGQHHARLVCLLAPAPVSQAVLEEEEAAVGVVHFIPDRAIHTPRRQRPPSWRAPQPLVVRRPGRRTQERLPGLDKRVERTLG